MGPGGSDQKTREMRETKGYIAKGRAFTEGWLFQNSGFGERSPCTKARNEGAFGCSRAPKKLGQGYIGFSPVRHRKNLDSHRRDRILRSFLRPEIGQFSAHFGAISLLTYTENLEKKEKNIHWRKFRKSSGEVSPKLQISVPCRGQTCPDLYQKQEQGHICQNRPFTKPPFASPREG